MGSGRGTPGGPTNLEAGPLRGPSFLGLRPVKAQITRLARDEHSVEMAFAGFQLVVEHQEPPTPARLLGRRLSPSRASRHPVRILLAPGRFTRVGWILLWRSVIHTGSSLAVGARWAPAKTALGTSAGAETDLRHALAAEQDRYLLLVPRGVTQAGPAAALPD